MLNITSETRGPGGVGITIEGLRPKDVERLRGCIEGHNWMGAKDGNLVFVDSHNPLPDPTDDLEMLPFWRPSTEVQRLNFNYDLIELDVIPNGHRFSMTIQSLCGYNYSPESYRDFAIILESYGFECLRSRRRDDGRYTEVWLLESLSLAKGKLGEEIRNFKGKKQLKAALDFLSSRRSCVLFGTLDVSFQQLAMAID